MKRIAAIDFLRALAIIGMVASGSMFWHAELPAAMFHAQLPPPTFVFNPDVAGITWVDLVFPFFLFSMGASMPLALRRREEKGAGTITILRSALHRYVWLAAFAIILGNTGMYLLGDSSQYVASLATLCIWILFFVMFIRVPHMNSRRNTILNWVGFALLIGATLLYKPLFGVDVDIERNNIIILILANKCNSQRRLIGNEAL
jgi:predicted acyltransferase